MEQILKNSTAKIRATFTDPDGAATEPDTPTVSITRDSDGEEIAVDQDATAEAAAGVVSYTLDPEDIPTVDLLRASWAATDASAADTEVGVVGGFLISLEAIEAAVEGTPTTLELRGLREEVEQKLESACNVAFRPSYARETLQGDGTDTLLPSRRRPVAILAATIGEEDVSDQLTISPDGLFTRTGRAFLPTEELDIAYSHGWPTPPGPVTRAAGKLAAAFNAGGDDRVNRFREDDQEFFLSVADGKHSTGIPEVDRVIRDYGYPAFL